MTVANSELCEHDNGEIPNNLSGTCIKCSADLDRVYIEKRFNFIEDRLSRIEKVNGVK